MATETEIGIILEQNKRHGDRLDNLTQLVDKDRSQLDQNTIDISSIKKGQEAILNQMADFKEEIRQIVLDTIKEEVPKAVKKSIARELTAMTLENPKKVIVRRVGLLEWLRLKRFK